MGRAARRHARRDQGRDTQPERRYDSTSPGARPPVVLLVTAVLLAVVVYLGALHNPFVYDDVGTVVGNPTIRDLGNLRGIVLFSVFRPLVNFSYAIDYALGGPRPLVFHLSSVLLHALNVALLFLLAGRLAEDAWGPQPGRRASVLAFTAAALLAVHPLMTEAVAYVSGRAEVLCATFFLASFLALRAYLRGGRWRYLALGLVCFALALASKETAAVLPLVLLAYDWVLLPADRQARRRRLRLHVPLLGFVTLAAGARVLVYLFVERFTGIEHPWLNILVEATVVWRYVALLLLPVSLSVCHEVRRITSVADPTALAALLALAAAAWGAWCLRRRQPIAALGCLWFLVALAPSHVVPLSEAMAEHRVYTASAGFFLAAAALVLALEQRWAARLGHLTTFVVPPLLLAAAALTVVRTRVWADPVRLWGDAAVKAPRTWAAQYGYADALRNAERCAEAVPVFERAIQLVPEAEEAHLNLGICLAQLGRLDQAREAFLAGARVAPSSPKPYNNLTMLAILAGDPARAQGFAAEALARDPTNVRARELLARIYESLRDHARAAAVCEEIRALAPETPGVDECITRNRGALGRPAPSSR